mmetsp:Transcript_53669/g.154743  ORF Transcript_53669/g.154743 Transcript_53669/m.154743 type:complete len:272 (-) Transcript_53669:1523-2338(-)
MPRASELSNAKSASASDCWSTMNSRRRKRADVVSTRAEMARNATRMNGPGSADLGIGLESPSNFLTMASADGSGSTSVPASTQIARSPRQWISRLKLLKAPSTTPSPAFKATVPLERRQMEAITSLSASTLPWRIAYMRPPIGPDSVQFFPSNVRNSDLADAKGNQVPAPPDQRISPFFSISPESNPDKSLRTLPSGKTANFAEASPVTSPPRTVWMRSQGWASSVHRRPSTAFRISSMAAVVAQGLEPPSHWISPVSNILPVLGVPPKPV